MTHRRIVITSLSLALVGLLGLSACGGSGEQAQQGAQGAPELPVRTLASSDFSVDNSYPAVIRGEDDAEIRPKVSGFITKVLVSEGQAVRPGQALFQLDDVTYRAAVNQATASLTSAQAALSTAQLNERNSKELLAKNIISTSAYEEVANALSSAQAGVAVAKANLTAARENLSFCTVSSPVAGVVGSINYRVGNLVSPQSAQALTQVSNTKQAFVYFSLSERELRSYTGGQVSGDLTTLFPKVRLTLADGSSYPEEGTVKGVSGVIDRTTGSVTLRVDFPNAAGQLRSGGVGTIHLPARTTAAILVPQSATVEMLHKKFVYTLGSDGKVKFTEITVSPYDDGQSYTVTSGLKVGDRIVTAGTTTLREGMEIKALSEAEYAARQEAIQKQMMGGGAQRK